MIHTALLWLFLLSSADFVHSRGFDAATKADKSPFLSIVPSHDLNWIPCFHDSPASNRSNVSCARLIAPLDHTNVSLGNVELAIVKLSGSGSGKAVFYNPGGPGSDPSDDILNNAPLLRAYVGPDYDIIGVVPRAVGATFPAITCDATEYAAIRRFWETDDTLPGYTPTSLVDSYLIGENLGLDCESFQPDLVPYSGTVSVARDMEFVRQALGQSHLHYLGGSYGTVLGGTYAALYPDRVGRMVLDSVVDFNDWYSPIHDPSRHIGDADLGLEFFFTACHDAGSEACAIWSEDISSIKQAFYTADRSIHEKPLPVPGFGLVKWPLWRLGVYNALYKPALNFPVLAGITSEILNGSAGQYIEAYVQVAEAPITSFRENPTDPKTDLKNSLNNNPLISCSDSGAPSDDFTIEQLDQAFAKYREVSSFFAGVAAQSNFICWGAKLSSKERYSMRFENITTANPIVFIGNTADPTTPIRNAHRMQEVFSGSQLLAVNGTGHLSYNAAQDVSCITKWVVPYFRDGTLPPEGTVCAGMQNPFTSTVKN